MAKNKATTKSTGKTPEENNYFEGMEPVAIPAIDRAIKDRESAKQAFESAKESLEAAEAKLQRAMHANMEHEGMGMDASGNKRYLSKKLEIVAVLEVKEATEKVKLKKAPTAKAPKSEG